MTKPKTPNKEPEKKTPEQEEECRYVAHCTEDGVCPYNVHELMKKVRLQAVKDTLKLIKLEKGEYPTIYMDEE